MALLLSRKLNETIELNTQDGKITISVMNWIRWDGRITGVMLGIDAPHSVAIKRDNMKEGIKND